MSLIETELTSFPLMSLNTNSDPNKSGVTFTATPSSNGEIETLSSIAA